MVKGRADRSTVVTVSLKMRVPNFSDWALMDRKGVDGGEGEGEMRWSS
jgi:hypothetical protein